MYWNMKSVMLMYIKMIFVVILKYIENFVYVFDMYKRVEWYSIFKSNVFLME